jgi:hypothetical protein
MIRPFTFLCLLLAGGSGLYLYQVKHRTRLLEIEIDRTLHQAATVREQTGLLQAEWAFLNDPSRLAGLAEQQLSLKPMDSRQFVQMADLDRHLPAVPPPPPAPPPAPAGEALPDAGATPVAGGVPASLVPAVALAVPSPAATQAPTDVKAAPHEAAVPVPPHKVAVAAAPRKVAATVIRHPVTPARVPEAPLAASASYQPAAGRPMPPFAAGGSALGSFRTALPPPVPIPTTPATFQAVRSGR